MANILFFDTETTGIPLDYKASPTDSENWPRLVQLGWILTNESGQILKEGNRIVRPDGFDIPTAASDIHRITTARALAEGLPLSAVITEFTTDLQTVGRVVGHNLSFDLHIVAAEMYRLGLDYHQLFDLPNTCTMLSTIDYCAIPGAYGYKWPKLQELHMQLFGVGFHEAHDAMIDIRATRACYFALCKQGIL